MPILGLTLLLQLVFGLRVVARMLGSARGTRIGDDPPANVPASAISVIVPVLDERTRLPGCLERLIACGPEVGEILVVDGGSIDGTGLIAAAFAARDARVRSLNAPPVPAGWNGKAWNLECGLRASSPGATWIATIDADVRVRPGLARAVIAHAQRRDVHALSVAVSQELGDPGSGIVHPAMLATLVYRFGLPGHATTRVAAVQASGQCFFIRRALLAATGVLAQARASVCEDVTMARLLARAGHRVGFYEAGDLVTVRMHDTWREVWSNWPRSLTLRDGISTRDMLTGLAEIALVQALPIPLLLGLFVCGANAVLAKPAFQLNGILLFMRIGVLAGTRRAYRNPTWTYWLSLFADLPVAAALIASALRKRHTWRGRALVTSERIT